MLSRLSFFDDKEYEKEQKPMKKQLTIPSVEVSSIDKFLKLTTMESARVGRRIPQRVMFERAIDALEREMTEAHDDRS